MGSIRPLDMTRNDFYFFGERVHCEMAKELNYRPLRGPSTKEYPQNASNERLPKNKFVWLSKPPKTEKLLQWNK